MMNALAVSLVLTSLLTAAVWSPSVLHDDHRDDQVIVKEGHRVVVVEYDDEATATTKVSISPPEDVQNQTSNKDKSAEEGMFADAYSKCKHKLANAFGKTKETATEIADKAREVEEDAKDSGADQRLSETVTGSTIGETLGKAKQTVAHGIGKAKKVAEDVKETVRDGTSKDFDIVDSPKRLGEDITRNVTGRVKEKTQPVKEKAKETVQKSAQEILSKMREIGYDVVGYLFYRNKIDSVVNLVHMLGFSTAYGMCVWVTFVSSYILGRYLPRQTFGMVQSRIYPVYFKAMAYCVSAALFGHLVSQKGEILTGKMEMFQGFSLLSALLMVLTNMILLEPKATEAMYRRMKIEKEEGRGLGVGVVFAGKDGTVDSNGATRVRPAVSVVAERRDVMRLNENLKRLNVYSSALNLATLVTLTWHMAYMGQQLQVCAK